MEAFKQALRKLVAKEIGELEFDSFRYDTCDSWTLRKVFVLLNLLEAQRRRERFSFNLYREKRWEVEHIASQTDNPLSEKKDQEEWLELARAEMFAEDAEKLASCKTFAEQWKKVWAIFEKNGDLVDDKNEMGNLALLDAGTNRSYKNAPFPAKRRTILHLGRDAVRKDGAYVPPATEAAFSKVYSPAAAQMRYWSKADAKAYHGEMEAMFRNFMEESK